MATKKSAKRPAVRFTKAQMEVIARMFDRFMREEVKPRVLKTVELETKQFREMGNRVDAIEHAVKKLGGVIVQEP